MGHKSPHVTETVYRHVIVPAIRGGANVMDTVFGNDPEDGNGAAGVAATPLELTLGLALDQQT